MIGLNTDHSESTCENSGSICKGNSRVKLLKLVRNLVGRLSLSSKALDQWYEVKFDDETVFLKAEPPGCEAWSQCFLWSEVERICFKAEGLEASDGIYVFTSQRPESFVIPTEAKGGAEFWSEVLDRGLFDAELAVRAASAVSGTFCWPDD